MTEARRLPHTYYLDHFTLVVEGVAARYAFLLSPAERGHIARLRRLTPPALMLYARLVNRRGPCFRVSRLDYPEIAPLDGAVAELLAHGLLEPCSATPAGAAPAGAAPETAGGDVLACFTLAELRASLGARAAPAGAAPAGAEPACAAPSGLRRPALLAWLAAWDGRQAWLAALLRQHAVVRIPATDPWPFLRFLFFGELRDNLADFVTRALGHVVTESFSAPQLAPLFATRRQAEDAFRMATLYAAFRAIRAARTPAELLAWWRAQMVARETLAAGQDWFDRLADRLGKILEQAGLTEPALALYAASPVAPARERRARLLLKSGRRAEALALLHEIQEYPCHIEEAYAARQLLARLARTAPRSEARGMERASLAVVLHHPDGAAEAALLAHYRAQGWQGVHAENWLWTAAFGLLLWDIIYDPALGVFHSPLQRAPSDLYDPSFYPRRQAAIEARLALLEQPETALGIVRRHFGLKAGLATPFVAWHDGLPAVLDVMLRRVPAAGLAAALRRMAQDYGRHARGLPDLFLWTEKDYRFVEVKAATDHLAPHQYEWLRFLRQAGIQVALEKIRRPAIPASAAAPDRVPAS